MWEGRTETLGQGQSFDCVTVHPSCNSFLGSRRSAAVFCRDTEGDWGQLGLFLGGKAHRPRELFSCWVIEDHVGRKTRSLLWAGWGQLGKFQGEAGVELRPGRCWASPGCWAQTGPGRSSKSPSLGPSGSPQSRLCGGRSMGRALISLRDTQRHTESRAPQTDTTLCLEL